MATLFTIDFQQALKLRTGSGVGGGEVESQNSAESTTFMSSKSKARPDLDTILAWVTATLLQSVLPPNAHKGLRSIDRHTTPCPQVTRLTVEVHRLDDVQ